MEGTNSETLSNFFGIAHGFSLGYLFFLLYINDFINSAEYLPRLLADDTCLVVPNRDVLITEQEMVKNLLRFMNGAVPIN